ncbi:MULTISPECIES: hypothetical protein [Phyllobacteriaceae]|uniref:Uncharacterized protein n=1 Tax=Phyllobacterium phragmitis TaxID=2670329 RepID=A0ABQ0H166_9HYPH|nr:hypothetical protein [Mesorhizobium sp. RMAD-H1]MBB2971303.1 hypothetical protein [Mesorhizobium sp. RMAD-H1]
MMAAVFALLSLALVLGWFGRRSIALLCILLCLAVAVKEFLWEIHSSEYGYRMPWIQTRLIDRLPAAPQALAGHRLTETHGGRA